MPDAGGHAIAALVWLDWAGVALFAATGALVASRRMMDPVGFVFLATLTGVGGGTVRDLVLGAPVFWVAAPEVLWLCAAAAAAVWLTAHHLESRLRWVLWLDAAALAAYGVFGASKGLAATGSPSVAVVMGMMTATLGGLLRDVVAGEPTILSRRELYVSAAAAGAAAFVAADAAGLPRPASASAGFLLAFGLRAGALRFGWALPDRRARPGRPADESLRRRAR